MAVCQSFSCAGLARFDAHSDMYWWDMQPGFAYAHALCNVAAVSALTAAKDGTQAMFPHLMYMMRGFHAESSLFYLISSAWHVCGMFDL